MKNPFTAEQERLADIMLVHTYAAQKLRRIYKKLSTPQDNFRNVGFDVLSYINDEIDNEEKLFNKAQKAFRECGGLDAAFEAIGKEHLK